MVYKCVQHHGGSTSVCLLLVSHRALERGKTNKLRPGRHRETDKESVEMNLLSVIPVTGVVLLK
jgi:hypothetical protein